MFLTLFGFSLYCHTGKGIKRACALVGLRHPADITAMYLKGESAEYLQAAVYTVNQSGE